MTEKPSFIDSSYSFICREGHQAMSAVANDEHIIIIIPSVHLLSRSFCRPIFTIKLKMSE